VVVPAGAVDVAVLELFGGGVADVLDGDVELEGDAGEGVVGVDGDLVVVHSRDGDDAAAVGGLGGELHAGLDVGDALEAVAGDALDELRVALAVALVGLDGDLDLIAGALAFEGGFEAGDDVAGAVEVGEGLAALGGVEDVALGGW
jgi:hypothetical protein